MAMVLIQVGIVLIAVSFILRALENIEGAIHELTEETKKGRS